MHHVAQVRSVCHTETVHDPAVYQMLTGRKHFSSAGNLTVQPNDFPQLGTLFGALDEAAAVMPKVVELPETMKMEGRVLPGQNAGFLGATYDPFRLEMGAETQILPPEFTPHADISRERLARRASLLEQVHQRHRASIGKARRTNLTVFSNKLWLCCRGRRCGAHSTSDWSPAVCATRMAAIVMVNRSCSPAGS